MSDHQSGMPGVVRMSLYLLGIFVAIMIGLTIYSRFTFHPVTTLMTVGGRSHTVLVAKTPQAHYQGLSGTTVGTLGAEGMYFPFVDEGERTFVMRGMLFPLDFLWMRDGRVVKIEENVPAPAANEQPKLVYSEPEKVDGVFEFPAGFVNQNKVIVGDAVTVR